MSDTADRDFCARRVFSGLEPSVTALGDLHADLPFRATRLGKGVMATVPIVLAGAMTVSMNLTGPIDSASAAAKRPARVKTELSKTLRELLGSAASTTAESHTASGAGADRSSASNSTTAVAAPLRYTVRAGDSVSSIAGRYGLSTASVLAANGLSWKSMIFPGQVLRLTTPIPATAVTRTSTPATPITTPTAATSGGRYTIKKGDTISRIASRHGMSTASVLRANGLTASSIIYPGQTIAIPGASTGIAVQTVASITPAAPPAAAPSDPAASTSAAHSSYTIRRGDTLSSIARSTGVSVASILAANRLVVSSIIYAGRTLVIPGGATRIVLAASVAPRALPTAGSTSPLTAEEAANARVIIQVGRRLGVSDRGIVIALSAAAQESGLRNLTFGDRDSVGVFQQRPSAGWGARGQLLSVDYAAQLFYGGPRNPNAGNTRGLLDIAGWQAMTVTQAAQSVQISAYPTAYATWETSAEAWLAHYR